MYRGTVKAYSTVTVRYRGTACAVLWCGTQGPRLDSAVGCPCTKVVGTVVRVSWTTVHALYGMYTVGEIMLYNNFLFSTPGEAPRARALRGGKFKSGRLVTHPHRPHPHRLHSQRRRLAAGSSRSPCTLQQTRLRTSAFVPAPEWPRGDEISNCVRRGRPLFGIHAAAVLRSEPRGWP